MPELEDYMDKLAIETFGEKKFYEIIHALHEVPNGLCGVELYHSTLPKLLAKQGIVPIKTYAAEYGQPKDDGKQAATPAQRQVIEDALKKAGF